MSVKGSCLCGGIKYEIDGAFGRVVSCHCSMCRKATGAAFRTRAKLATAALRWLSGEQLLSRYESSPGETRTFCRVCGSTLPTFFRDRPGEIGLPLGTLDEDPGVRPSAHVWVESKAPWWEIADGLPRYGEGLEGTCLSELHVRLATIEDVSAIARVHVRSWQSAYRGQIADALIDAFDEAARARSWSARIQVAEHAIHVAARGGDVIGFCSLIRARDPGSSDDTGEIAALYVDPAHWRSGAGAGLLHASIDVARRTGYRILTLWVLASNARARHFYEHCGFARDGQTKGQAGADGSMFELRYRRELK